MSQNISDLPGIAHNITNVSQCNVQLCDIKLWGQVQYVPSLFGNVLYLAIFALFLCTQLIQVYFYRTWSYTFAMFAGLLLEVLGYYGRIEMHNNIFESNPFLLYLICLTIAPVFFTAALYLTLSRVITHYGAHNSRVSPKIYTLSFMASDFIALLLQAAGGAIADTASATSGKNTGVNIMIAGLAFQVISIVVFIALCAEFFWNVSKEQKNSRNWASRMKEGKKGFRVFIAAMALATLFILVRSTFRVAELVHGFNGKLANEEVPFMILEGAMIIVATGLMTILHPGSYLSTWAVAGWSFKKSSMENRNKN
ncbi:hypothetical protein B7494_g1120 [Chlorociboria aeruginascens]|nr:hypothetical protein B7494_g1120 [Chlorociboria aeruginascens]